MFFVDTPVAVMKECACQMGAVTGVDCSARGRRGPEHVGTDSDACSLTGASCNRIGDRMEILSGVKVGEQVALTDVDNLTDGLLVAVNDKQE